MPSTAPSDGAPTSGGDAAVSDFRLAPALRARMLGGAIVAAAALVFVATGVIVLFAAPVWILWVAVGLALAGIFAAGGLLNAAWVVRLDRTGYRVRLVRGAGVPRGRWSEIEDVVTAEVSGVSCLLLRRLDGQQTSVPLAAVAEHERLLDEVRAHLEGRSGRPRPRRRS